MKDLEFLMKNKAEIFNITPPNAKDEDKLNKGAGKYQLINKAINPEWRGFKSSHITSHKQKGTQRSSNYGSTYSSNKKYSAQGYYMNN